MFSNSPPECKPVSHHRDEHRRLPLKCNATLLIVYYQNVFCILNIIIPLQIPFHHNDLVFNYYCLNR